MSNSDPWLQMMDNEWSSWGGLADKQVDTLIRWFLGQRPLAPTAQEFSCPPAVADQLRAGLFDHGWTRNGGTGQRGPSADHR